MEGILPFPLSTLVSLPAQSLFAWTAIAVGTVILLWALLTFARNRTAVYPNRPARLVVCNGPYRFSRNPMYVALTAIAVGIALLADNFWMLLFLPGVLVALTVFVIRREETYLRNAFGSEYSGYVARVRRWL